MKKIVIANVFILIGVLFLSEKPIYAQISSMPVLSEAEGMGLDNDETEVAREGHSESVEAVLQDILEQQNVSTIQELNLTKVGDDEWERLGDAMMEVQHPGQAHEAMDQMMGGEGSESLRQIHINMGKAYLGYGDNYGPGMMGGGMMSNWNNNSLKGGGFPMIGFSSMMGYGGFSNVHGLLAGTTWIALIIFLVAGTYFFIKQAGKK